MIKTLVGLILCVLLFSSVSYSQVTYRKNTQKEAQQRIDQALLEVPRLILKKSCTEAIKEELGYDTSKKLLVPLYGVGYLSFGYNPAIKNIDLT